MRVKEHESQGTDRMKFKDELTENESEEFPVFKRFENEESYHKEYEKALKFANRKKKYRQVYTMVDTEGNKTAYLKGCHLVNRFGYCVLGTK